MILELDAKRTYLDTATGVVYHVERDAEATIALYGPGHPEIRQDRIALDRAGNWENQKFEEFQHVEPFYTFIGFPARRLLAWLIEESCRVLSREGRPEAMLDSFVARHLGGGYDDQGS